MTKTTEFEYVIGKNKFHVFVVRRNEEPLKIQVTQLAPKAKKDNMVSQGLFSTHEWFMIERRAEFLLNPMKEV